MPFLHPFDDIKVAGCNSESVQDSDNRIVEHRHELLRRMACGTPERTCHAHHGLLSSDATMWEDWTHTVRSQLVLLLYVQLHER
jgi:hypothetical protein